MFLPSRKLSSVTGVCGLALVLAACSTAPIAPEPYAKWVRGQAATAQPWSLEGRLALSAKKDSWSATVSWQHDPLLDQIKLSGPLGQGAAIIRLTKDRVVIDRGGQDVQASSDPEPFIAQQLGMAVPIHALRYWVVGLPEPGVPVFETESGFKQAEWLVSYKDMQRAGKLLLPRKILVTNDQVRLKLLIDQWIRDDAQPK